MARRKVGLEPYGASSVVRDAASLALEARAPAVPRLTVPAGLVLVSRGASLVMGVGVTVLLSRTLGASGFGTFVLALTLLQFGLIFPDGALNPLLVREALRSNLDGGQMLRWFTAAKLLFALPLAAVLIWVGMILVGPGLPAIAVALVIGSAPLAALTTGLSLIQRHFRLKEMAVLIAIQSVMWTTAVILLSSLRASLIDFAMAFFVVAAVFGVIIYVRASRLAATRRGEAFDLQRLRPLFRDAAALGLTALVIQGYGKLDSLLVYHLRGPAEAGLYGLAYKFIEQSAILPISLSNAFLPLLSSAHFGGVRMRQTFERYLNVSLLTAIPVAVVAMMLAKPLIPLVFGTQYQRSADLLRILMPAFVAVCLGWAFAQVAIVNARNFARLCVSLGALVMNLCLNLLLVPQYGASGAAIATLATELVVVVGLMIVVRGTARVSPSASWLMRLGLCIVVGLVAATVASIGGYVAAVAAFLVTYLACARFTGLVPALRSVPDMFNSAE